MLIPDKFNSNYNIRMIKLNYKDLNIDLLNIIEQKYRSYIDQLKIKIYNCDRNITKKLGRPVIIPIKKVIINAFKIIKGSKLEDLVERKQISSYAKYIPRGC